MTHLLQPIDHTTNASVKKMEKHGFVVIILHPLQCITKVLENKSKRDVTAIKVHWKLSSLKAKPGHAKVHVLMEIYDFLRSEKGKKIIQKQRHCY